MITVIIWHWAGLYTHDHVNRLAAAVNRNLALPHQIVCITDNPFGLNPRITEPYPLKYTGGKRNARRLWLFSDDAVHAFGGPGSVLLQLDLDMVVTASIDPLLTHFLANPAATFQIWRCRMSSRYRFGLNPSFMAFRAGAHPIVWTDFITDPDARLLRANRNGWPASDQAVISDHFTRPTGLTTADILCPTWDASDGIISMRDELIDTAQHPAQHVHTPLPPHTRLVSFHGRFNPDQFTQLDWVKQHWLAVQPRSDIIPPVPQLKPCEEGETNP